MEWSVSDLSPVLGVIGKVDCVVSAVRPLTFGASITREGLSASRAMGRIETVYRCTKSEAGLAGLRALPDSLQGAGEANSSRSSTWLAAEE